MKNSTFRILWNLGGLSMAILGALFALTFLSSCSGESSGDQRAGNAPRKRAMPVTASIATVKTVPVQLTAVGNVQAYSTVSISAQVSGELVSVHFKEGQEVKKGDLLFTIDPRPFQAQLNQAKANLAKDQVQLENALNQVKRNASVVDKGYVSRDQYDRLVANAAALKASVQAEKAAVENAALQLQYCFIKSPIGGFTGQIKIHQGNLVKANDNGNPMVVIKQVSPIQVAFSVPERNLQAIKRYMASGKLEVVATVPSDGERPVRGALSFLDNAVDRSTGTIQLKATFPNKDRSLWPGEYVNVVLILTTKPNAVVLPSQAVQRGQEGSYVFVVKPDLTVEYRPVVVGATVGNDVVIKKGISPGEKVVTDGQLRLGPGAHVRIVKGVEERDGDIHP